MTVTYDELYKRALNVLGLDGSIVDDWRPASDIYVDEIKGIIPNGITIWLKSGYEIIFIDRESKDDDNVTKPKETKYLFTYKMRYKDTDGRYRTDDCSCTVTFKDGDLMTPKKMEQIKETLKEKAAERDSSVKEVTDLVCTGWYKFE